MRGWSIGGFFSKNSNFVVTCLLLIVLFAGAYYFRYTNDTSSHAGAPEESGSVVRVVDGDTIDVKIGGAEKRVRLIGVNAPESVKPETPVECYGKEASDYAKKLLEGKQVRLETDRSNTDKYDRLLRYVYLASNGNSTVNELIVEGGYARAVSYPPNTKYDSAFKAAELRAQEKEAGLWTACK